MFSGGSAGRSRIGTMSSCMDGSNASLECTEVEATGVEEVCG